MMKIKLVLSSKTYLLLIVLFLFFLINKVIAEDKVIADNNKISMEFTSELCDDMEYDPLVNPDINSAYGKKWKKHAPRRFSTTWIDTNKLKVIKYIKLNCGAEVIKGEFKIKENEINLSYFWREKMMAMCSCTRKIEFTFDNLEKKKYKFSVKRIELPHWRPDQPYN